MDDNKYYVTIAKGFEEKALYVYDNEDMAIAQMKVVGRKLKPRDGLACVVKGHLDEDGNISVFGEEVIAVYDKWLERFKATMYDD